MTVTLIANRYHLVERLGVGGMGTVYRAADRTSGQIVAVKQLRSDMALPDMIERFKREGEALRTLNHPNIVKLLDTLEDQGQYFLVMEYVSGGDLKALLNDGGLPINRVVSIGLDLADALTRAHRLNIVHRDLKPANVLLAADGTPRLTDFGVARFGGRDPLTESGMAVGTIDYLAPEVLNGDPIDARVDVWALGVLLFEMLTGRRPFEGENIGQVIKAILLQHPPDLEVLRPDCPVALVDLIYRMLVKDSYVRIASVRHVGAELEDILQQRRAAPAIAFAAEGATPADATPRFLTPTPTYAFSTKHNLPAQVTPFVGREAELAELARLLEHPSVRLVTILASGGMGKTRLSLAAGEQALDRFPQGVFFVELAPLLDAANIPAAIASAVGFQFQQGDQDQRKQVLDYLSNKQMLLIMDNFEQFAADASIVTDLLERSPALKILATSRARLEQPGEAVMHLTGISLPMTITLDTAMENAAVKLFVLTAQRAQPTFTLTAQNLDVVVRICRLVAGAPLAIVLAATWLALLSPDEVLSEIQRSIGFLESSTAGLPERQRSIRAVLDYSWGQMTPDEQQVYQKLSVFRGGFTRSAAEMVGGASLRLLLGLVNKSLLGRDMTSGRFSHHELLRQYAEDRLLASGEMDSVREAHSQFSLGWVSEAFNALVDRRQIEMFDAIEQEYENIRAAWRWAVAQGQFERLSDAGRTLWLYGLRRGRTVEPYQMFSAALAAIAAQAPTKSVAWAKLTLKWCALSIELAGKTDYIHDRLQTALQVVEAADASFDMWFGSFQLGIWYFAARQVSQAWAAAEHASTLAEARLGPWAQAITLHFRSFIAPAAGYPDYLEVYSRRAYEIASRAGDYSQLAKSAFNLGVAAENENDLDGAMHYYEQALTAARKVKAASVGLALSALGNVQMMRADLNSAEQYVAEGLAIARDTMNLNTLGQTLRFYAVLRYYQDRLDDALELAREAVNVTERDYSPYALRAAHSTLTMILCWSARYEEGQRAAAQWLRELALEQGSELDALEVLLNLLPLVWHKGHAELAVQMLACFLHSPMLVPVQSQDPHLRRLEAQLRERLDRVAFETAWAQGQTANIMALAERVVRQFDTP